MYTNYGIVVLYEYIISQFPLQIKNDFIGGVYQNK